MSRTFSRKVLRRELRRERLLGRVEPDEDLVRVELEEARPRTRADCEDGPRPCPFVSCKFHLYLDVTPAGSLKLNFPDKEVWELEESCALDVADRGGQSLAAVGERLNLTRQRVDQLEHAALAAVRAAVETSAR